MENATSKNVKTVPAQDVSQTNGPESSVNGKPAGIRTASEEQFKKAHRKTKALHGGLFRRLAK